VERRDVMGMGCSLPLIRGRVVQGSDKKRNADAGSSLRKEIKSKEFEIFLHPD
jgi:hypothetical protein